MSMFDEIYNLSNSPRNISDEVWNLAKIVFPLANDYYGRIHGGFLRDLIAGIEPEDLDIDFTCFSNRYITTNVGIFINTLEKYYPIIEKSEELDDKYSDTFGITKVSLIKISIIFPTKRNETIPKRMKIEEKKFKIDLCVAGVTKPHLDFDINSLYLDRRTDVTEQLKCKYDGSVDSILLNIRQGICIPGCCGPNCSLTRQTIQEIQCRIPRHRVEKMRNKGWNIINLDSIQLCILKKRD